MSEQEQDLFAAPANFFDEQGLKSILARGSALTIAPFPIRIYDDDATIGNGPDTF